MHGYLKVNLHLGIDCQRLVSSQIITLSQYFLSVLWKFIFFDVCWCLLYTDFICISMLCASLSTKSSLDPSHSSQLWIHVRVTWSFWNTDPGGPPWWSSGKESVFQYRGCGFDLWSEDQDPTCHGATKLECCNERSPRSAPTEPSATTKAQHRQKANKINGFRDFPGGAVDEIKNLGPLGK